jgi:ribosomal protein S18 acetylase RimI-like enzyme
VRNETALRVVDQVSFLARLEALIDVYDLAMQPTPDQLAGRRPIMQQHTFHPAFRAVIATAGPAAGAGPRDRAAGPGPAGRAAGPGPPGRAAGTSPAGPDDGTDDGAGPADRVVAFAYGFTGAAGQWWHDVVRAGLTVAAGAPAAAAWLADTFEIAEVHVRPEFQRRGIGRAMLLSLTAGCPHRTALLSTLDSASSARRLYRKVGFGELLTGFSFPGNGPPYIVMGAVLPLRG